jgi:hypothetical protein
MGIGEKAILLHATLFYKYNPARTQRPVISAQRTAVCACRVRTAQRQARLLGNSSELMVGWNTIMWLPFYSHSLPNAARYVY